MTTKTVYLKPGDTINIRIVPGEDLGRNYPDWVDSSVMPRHILLLVKDFNRIAVANPMVHVVPWTDPK